jgi:hypothetical protein
VWVTEAELDNLGFILERAYEEEGDYMQIASYESLDALRGAGNSSEKRRYVFIDPSVFNDITYWYRLIDVSVHGVQTVHPAVSATPIKPDIDMVDDPPEEIDIPKQIKLNQNYPNPFNPKTMINYQLSMISKIELSIYNASGQIVSTLVSEIKEAGIHQVEWDASGFASGVYYYHIQAGELHDVKKMILLR